MGLTVNPNTVERENYFARTGNRTMIPPLSSLFLLTLLTQLFQHVDNCDTNVILFCVVTCRDLCVTYRRVLEWMIVFIGTLFTHLGSKDNTVLSLIYTL
jgi:hypothetical protein